MRGNLDYFGGLFPPNGLHDYFLFKTQYVFATALWSFIQPRIVGQFRKHAAPGALCFSMQFLVDRTTYTTVLVFDV